MASSSGQSAAALERVRLNFKPCRAREALTQTHPIDRHLPICGEYNLHGFQLNTAQCNSKHLNHLDTGHDLGGTCTMDLPSQDGGHNEYKDISSTSYFPKGKEMISGSGDKTVRRWDLRKGKEIEEAREVFEDGIDAVGVSRMADGLSLLLVGAQSQRG